MRTKTRGQSTRGNYAHKPLTTYRLCLPNSSTRYTDRGGRGWTFYTFKSYRWDKFGWSLFARDYISTGFTEIIINEHCKRRLRKRDKSIPVHLFDFLLFLLIDF